MVLGRYQKTVILACLLVGRGVILVVQFIHLERGHTDHDKTLKHSCAHTHSVKTDPLKGRNRRTYRLTRGAVLLAAERVPPNSVIGLP